MNRPVDRAMNESRPAKRVMREIWVRAVQEYADDSWAGTVPLYLTLPGASGDDINRLIDVGLITRSETGAIASDDLNKVVAIESNAQAVLDLQRKFPGLRILEQPLQNLIRNTSPLRWPDGEDQNLCKARVVNMDLNTVLGATQDDGSVAFPIIQLIRKFAQLHATTPRENWCLCLTLHGEIRWNSQTCQMVKDFLAENFSREPAFHESCRDILGVDLCQRIESTRAVNFQRLANDAQRALLMAFVPKIIIQKVHDQGWVVRTVRNLAYGGEAGTAPMVSWEFRFQWEARAEATPDVVYRESLRGIFEGRGRIEEDGTIS